MEIGAHGAGVATVDAGLPERMRPRTMALPVRRRVADGVRRGASPFGQGGGTASARFLTRWLRSCLLVML